MIALILQRIEELERRLAQMVVDGKVCEVDHDKHHVKVCYGNPESDKPLTTGWLKWDGIRAGKAKVWWPLEVGEAVTVLSPGDLSQGRIIASHYQADSPAQSNDPDLFQINFDDESTVSYHRANKEFKLLLPAGANTQIVTDGGLDITGNTKITGNLHVTGTTHSDDAITSNADVSDSKSSMQDMRDTYNSHAHKPDGLPTKNMS